MAKGNMLQGQATGKVGDIVFMVRNGQQVARVYTSAGGRSGDQASIAVRRQRVRFGAASNQYLLYRNIVRGMYRTGKSTKQSDYNFFVRENVDLLPYLTKEENAAGVKCAMPGTFSRGTLGTLIYSISDRTPEGGSRTYSINVSDLAPANDVDWDDMISDFKDALKSIFPNARKVTFAVIHLLLTEVFTPRGVQWSHTFERGDVIFDLYQEDANVADDSTVQAMFERYAPSFYSGFWNDLVGTPILTTRKLLNISSEGGADATLFDTMYILAFASNDQVGDCYTSVLDGLYVPDSDGGLSLYSKLRTDNHRQVAEDSYGYATGVMRTNIQQA